MFAHLLPWLGQLPSPVGWVELEAWARMTNRTPRRWELDLLIRLDYLRQQ